MDERMQAFLAAAASVAGLMKFAEPRIRKLPKLSVGFQEFLIGFLQIAAGVAAALMAHLNLFVAFSVNDELGMIVTGVALSVGSEAIEVLFKFVNGSVAVLYAWSFRIQSDAGGQVIPLEEKKQAA